VALGSDARIAKLRQALQVLLGPEPDRAERVQMIFSDMTPRRAPAPTASRAKTDGRRETASSNMKYIDPHIHCVSRTTDDYQYMARCGVVAVSEPAFWAGVRPLHRLQLRRLLPPPDRRRAQARCEVRHRPLLLALHQREEAENVALSREVIKLIPPLLDHPRVLGVGEIGLNKNTRNEITVFEEQVDVAARYDQLILIHTPHLTTSTRARRSSPAS
jgi:hypothetical protein